MEKWSRSSRAKPHFQYHIPVMMKDHAKTMLKQNENVLKGVKFTSLEKKSRSHMIKIEKSRKKSLDILARKSLPFAKSKQNAWGKALLLLGETS